MMDVKRFNKNNYADKFEIFVRSDYYYMARFELDKQKRHPNPDNDELIVFGKE